MAHIESLQVGKGPANLCHQHICHAHKTELPCEYQEYSQLQNLKGCNQAMSKNNIPFKTAAPATDTLMASILVLITTSPSSP